MPYFVVDPSGTQYGPADLPVLQQWVQEGRVLPSTILRDVATGQTMMATAIPGLFPSNYGPGAGGQTMGGSYAGQATYSGNPYSSNPYTNNPPQGYAYYPRPAQAPGSNDLTVAWVLGSIGIVSTFCVCPFIGIGFGIGGAIMARRASSSGDTRAQAPLVLSYAAIGLGAVFLVLNIIALASLRG